MYVRNYILHAVADVSDVFMLMEYEECSPVRPERLISHLIVAASGLGDGNRKLSYIPPVLTWR